MVGRAVLDTPPTVALSEWTAEMQTHSITLTPLEKYRFWTYVNVTRKMSCWEWQGYRNASGYGRYRVGKINTFAHRIAYIIHNGSIPEGMHVDHVCRNPACVNPFHLEAVTVAENMRRAVAAKKPERHPTHCKRGHELTRTNVYYYFDRGYHKYRCRKCHLENQRSRAAAKQLADSVSG